MLLVVLVLKHIPWPALSGGVLRIEADDDQPKVLARTEAGIGHAFDTIEIAGPQSVSQV